jgi:hypothetical protein
VAAAGHQDRQTGVAGADWDAAGTPSALKGSAAPSVTVVHASGQEAMNRCDRRPVAVAELSYLAFNPYVLQSANSRLPLEKYCCACYSVVVVEVEVLELMGQRRRCWMVQDQASDFAACAAL